MCFRILVLLALLMPIAGLHGKAAAETDAVSAIGKLLPGDAQVALVIPNLKRLSDDVTQMLEGMDRANVLIGSRPLDQLKSITGFNVAINDVGGAAIVLLREGQAEPAPLFILPVTDAQSFLKGNFKAHSGNEYSLADGSVVYAKAMTSHVAISPQADVIEQYQPDEAALLQIQESLGERAMPLMRNCELFFLVRQGGAKALRQMMINAAGPHAEQFPAEQFDAFADVETAIATIDLDPLALVVRNLARFTPESTLGKSVLQPDGPTSSLGSLPNKPFYMAISASPEAIELDVMMAPALQALRNAIAPDGPIRRIDFAAYPSPAGVSGGLLNDAVLVLHTNNPAELKKRIKDSLNVVDHTNGDRARQITWQEGKAVDGVGAVDAYEMKSVENAQSLPIQQMLERVVFGQMGMRGFVHTTDNAVVMTFSQRPAVLKSAIEAGGDSSTSLANSAVLKSMQNWLPAQLDFQMYLGVGQIAETARQVAASFGAANQIPIPNFDPNVPPIAIGADVIDAGMQSTVVIPSGVLAALIDSAVANMQNAGPAEEWNAP